MEDGFENDLLFEAHPDLRFIRNIQQIAKKAQEAGMKAQEAGMADYVRAHKSIQGVIRWLPDIQFDTPNNNTGRLWFEEERRQHQPQVPPAIIQRPRHLVLVDELKELPSEQRVDALLEQTIVKVEGLPQEQRTTFVIGLFKKFAPELEQRDSGLLVVHNHFHGVQNPPASVEQTQQEKEELPVSEDKTRPDKPKGGRPRLKAHQDALQRLQDEGQSKESNFYQWKKEYEKEMKINPDQTESGAWELYRTSVWRQNKPGKTG